MIVPGDLGPTEAFSILHLTIQAPLIYKLRLGIFQEQAFSCEFSSSPEQNEVQRKVKMRNNREEGRLNKLFPTSSKVRVWPELWLKLLVHTYFI